MIQAIRVAVIGAGYMAREHLRAFRALPNVQVSGIHSRTESRATALAAEFGVPQVCASVSELYRKTCAELVIVAVNELSVREVSSECFKFPWTVLIEKPAGYNLSDAEAIAAAAYTQKSQVYVALNRRSYMSTREALKMLQVDMEGARIVVVQDQQDQRAAMESGKPDAVVRNYMFANSIHVIDYLRVFGRGSVNRVDPVEPWNPVEPGNVVAKIEFSSGDIGLYQGVWDGPGPWAIAVTSRNVRVEMRPLEHLAFQRRGERRMTTVDLGSIDVEFKPGLRYQAEQAIAAARGAAADLPTLQDAMESMRLCARIFGMDRAS